MEQRSSSSLSVGSSDESQPILMTDQEKLKAECDTIIWPKPYTLNQDRYRSWVLKYNLGVKSKESKGYIFCNTEGRSGCHQIIKATNSTTSGMIKHLKSPHGISENDGKHLIQKTEIHFIRSNTNNSFLLPVYIAERVMADKEEAQKLRQQTRRKNGSRVMSKAYYEALIKNTDYDEEGVFPTKVTNDMIKTQFIKVLLNHQLPFNLSNSASVQQLLYMCQKADNPSIVNIPSDNTIKRDITKLYDDYKSKLKTYFYKSKKPSHLPWICGPIELVRTLLP
jgi:transcriptional regulator CtsR